MLPVFLAAYGTVFLAEIAGDKLLYTTGVLAARYRTAPILAGMLAAFAAKMAVAVAVGKALSMLPAAAVAAVTALNFFAIAYAVWRKTEWHALKETSAQSQSPAARAAAVSFAAIFFSEWGDIGQITAANLAARFGMPLVIWAAAVSAMATKGALAASVGAGLRRWMLRRLAPRTLRYAAVAALLVLGLLSAMEVLAGREGASL